MKWAVGSQGKGQKKTVAAIAAAPWLAHFPSALTAGNPSLPAFGADAGMGKL